MTATTLVWIDSREAVILRWRDGAPEIERIESDVPAHHRATGRVRHDPTVRHGGGGRPQTAGEPHRLEHLVRFVDVVARRLPVDDDLVILGPGTVREHLERSVRAADERHDRHRGVACRPAARLTDGQLVARLRHVVGADPRRRTVGAYRWDEAPPEIASGKAGRPPRRVSRKPAERPDRRAPRPEAESAI